jgi:uncharacterized protein (UPF0335 family)
MASFAEDRAARMLERVDRLQADLDAIQDALADLSGELEGVWADAFNAAHPDSDAESAD